MKRRTKNILIEAVAGTVILAVAGFCLHLYGFGPAAADPQTAPREAEQAAAGTPADGKDMPSKQARTVLPSAVAGSWYPATPAALKGQLKEYFDGVTIAPQDGVIGLILPHAGYAYSGKTACAGVKTADGHYGRIVVIGPSHNTPMEEVFSVPRFTHYETPLGQIPLDVEFIERLLQYPVFQNVPYAHEREHSVQIELPLLQFRDPDFKLVPIVAGHCTLETIRQAAAVLANMIDGQTLVVASSDFVHYGAGYGYVPFTEDIAGRIKKLDMGAVAFIKALDAPGFLEYREKTGATICGCVPIAVLLSMLDGSAKAELIAYATSGESEGDYSRSVSYVSMAFSGTWRKAAIVEPPPRPDGLTASDQGQLLDLARKTIAYALMHRKVPEIPELGVVIGDALKQPRAAFVTLKKDGLLRGCIGDIFPTQPLYKSVFSNALRAAFADRRFVPLQADELDGVTIEISALTIPQPVPSWDEIRIGTDGVVLSKAGRSAVFLPQVAGEQGWDLNETLTQLSKKAGLAADDWKGGASFLVFQAEVFGEGEK